ncbi:MAG: SAM-dependent methyltransferase, partial [Micromonosporaceae bacterium]|nr:SAM-dependent methyltransferase [Micromonosporaceae bacterium]
IESIIDLGRPNPARVGNALLGGGHNFAADRRAATRLLDADPMVATRLAVHRHLLRQATRVALDLGIKQFVQLGCGIPFPGGIHPLIGERPEAGRVVYVDPDPVVVELIEQATADDPTVTAIEADPGTLAGVLHDPRTRQVIGQGEPVLVMLAPRIPTAASPAQGPRPMSAAEQPDPEPGSPSRAFDTSKTHPSRRYDYWLGGKDHFAADRASGDQIAEAFPTVRQAAIENRRLLQRVVSYLVRDAGVTQFLDLGTGIPTSPNVHEIAQGIAPTARIVYVDHDPLVVAHGRALTTSTPEGATAYLHGDLREPATILDNPVLTQVLDLDRPIGLLLVAVLHFLTDTDAPYDVVHHLIEALPAGSFLALSHATLDPLPAGTAERLAALADPASGHGAFRFRDRTQIARFLDGLDLVEPGLTPIVEWRADAQPRPEATAAETAGYVAVARVP